MAYEKGKLDENLWIYVPGDCLCTLKITFLYKHLSGMGREPLFFGYSTRLLGRIILEAW